MFQYKLRFLTKKLILELYLPNILFRLYFMNVYQSYLYVRAYVLDLRQILSFWGLKFVQRGLTVFFKADKINLRFW